MIMLYENTLEIAKKYIHIVLIYTQSRLRILNLMKKKSFQKKKKMVLHWKKSK